MVIVSLDSGVGGIGGSAGSVGVVDNIWIDSGNVVCGKCFNGGGGW